MSGGRVDRGRTHPSRARARGHPADVAGRDAVTSAIPDAVLAGGGAVAPGAVMLAAAPLLKTVIKKMKARLQNRQGPPLLQGYYDLSKLLRKEPVRSEVASWIYVAGPRMYFAAALAATTLVPVVFAAAPPGAGGGRLVSAGGPG